MVNIYIRVAGFFLAIMPFQIQSADSVLLLRMSGFVKLVHHLPAIKSTGVAVSSILLSCFLAKKFVTKNNYNFIRDSSVCGNQDQVSSQARGLTGSGYTTRISCNIQGVENEDELVCKYNGDYEAIQKEWVRNEEILNSLWKEVCNEVAAMSCDQKKINDIHLKRHKLELQNEMLSRAFWHTINNLERNNRLLKGEVIFLDPNGLAELDFVKEEVRYIFKNILQQRRFKDDTKGAFYSANLFLKRRIRSIACCVHTDAVYRKAAEYAFCCFNIIEHVAEQDVEKVASYLVENSAYEVDKVFGSDKSWKDIAISITEKALEAS